jgi:hypothetical protein
MILRMSILTCVLVIQVTADSVTSSASHNRMNNEYESTTEDYGVEKSDLHSWQLSKMSPESQAKNTIQHSQCPELLLKGDSGATEQPSPKVFILSCAINGANVLQRSSYGFGSVQSISGLTQHLGTAVLGQEPDVMVVPKQTKRIYISMQNMILAVGRNLQFQPTRITFPVQQNVGWF